MKVTFPRENYCNYTTYFSIYNWHFTLIYTANVLKKNKVCNISQTYLAIILVSYCCYNKVA